MMQYSSLMKFQLSTQKLNSCEIFISVNYTYKESNTFVLYVGFTTRNIDF